MRPSRPRLPLRLVVLIGLVAGLLPAVASPAAAEDGGAVTVTRLTADGRVNPLGIDSAQPRLAWLLGAGGRSQHQTGYRIRVATTAGRLGHPDVWDSGRIGSDSSTGVAYGGPGLRSRTRYFWQVQVWDAQGRPSAWSPAGWWETGLMKPGDWTAGWAGAPGRTEWTDYRLDVDMRVTNLAVGVFFRAASAGDAYMWQVSVASGTPTLRTHVRRGGGYALLTAKPLALSRDDVTTKPFRLTVDAEGSTLRTSINGTLVDTATDATHPAGGIGFRTDGPEAGEVDAVTVTHGGSTLFADDFSGANPFTGGSVSGGLLHLGGPVDAVLAESTNNPYLRKGFRLDAPVRSARVYATALGLYELEINGARVGDARLAPGWTDYAKRVPYQTYDVTALLRRGDNAIGGLIGPGWYAGQVADFGTNKYGSRPYLKVQLEVVHTDGAVTRVVTDGSWRTAPSPVQYSDIMQGERYDAGKEVPGWSAAGYADAAWAPVAVRDGLGGPLVAQVEEPVRVTGEIKPVTLTSRPDGTVIADMGQNMVGVTRLRVRGPAGTAVRLRHAEELHPDGHLYTENLLGAAQTDTYTLAGDGQQMYAPRFTFHGFRYVEVSGYPGVLTRDDLTGLVVGSDLPTTGDLKTGDRLVDQLFHNIQWGQRGNFLSVPTDTPARAERLGWTGDAQMFVSTAAFNRDVQAFFTKWMRDVTDEQAANGGFSNYAPSVGVAATGIAGWGDAGVIVPWTIWRTYGDTRIVAEHWDAMARHVRYLEDSSTGLIRPATGYGDWLNVGDETPTDLIGTAYFAYCARLMSEMAAATGRTAQAREFAGLADRVTAAFQGRFVDADTGRVGSDSQTAYVLALRMNLLPDRLRATAADRLAELVKARGWHLSTGFLGTRDLLPALTDGGHADAAYRVLLQETYPSWGYQIAKGATTMWENWDAITEAGFKPTVYNSFNHYAYGAVGDWMYRTIGGISQEPGSVGWERLVIRPRPGDRITHATASYDSVRGRIATDWRVDGERFRATVTVPVGATAKVYLPAASALAVNEGGRAAGSAAGVRVLGVEDGNAVLEVGSGTYRFDTDPDRGAVREVAAAAAALRDGVGKAHLPGGVAGPLRADVSTMEREAREAVDAQSDGDVKGLAHHLAKAHLATERLSAQISRLERDGRLSADVARSLSESAATAQRWAAWELARLLGVRAALAVEPASVLPGGPVRATLTLTNAGREALAEPSLEVVTPEGWSGRPLERGAATALAPGASLTAAYELIPGGAVPAGPVVIAGRATVSHQGATIAVPATATVTVTPALRLDAVEVADRDLQAPDAPRTGRVTVANASTVAVRAAVSLTAAEGWTVSPASRDVEVPAGGTATAEFTVASPARLAGGVLRAVATYGGTARVARAVAVDATWWEFERDGDPQGWSPAYHLADVGVSGGALRARSVGNDPELEHAPPVAVDASRGATVEIAMRADVSSTGQLFWGFADTPYFCDCRRIEFGVTAGETRVYRLTIPPQPQQVTKLRLDPLVAPGSITIDSIRVVTTATVGS